SEETSQLQVTATNAADSPRKRHSSGWEDRSRDSVEERATMARESSEAVPVMDTAKSADATTAATAADAKTDTTDVKTTKKTAAAAPTTTPHGPVGRTLTGPWGASFSGEGTTGL